MTDLQAAIQALLGSAPEHIRAYGVTRFSTKNGSGNKDGWVKPGDDGAMYFGCWRQGLKGSYREHQERFNAFRPKNSPVQTSAEIKSSAIKLVAAKNLSVWTDAFDLEPTSVASQYLNRRGLRLQAFPKPLRQACLGYYEDGKQVGTFAVMLGLVTCPYGEMVALHRTYLAADGSKAPVASVKKLTRTSGPLGGASIKFNEPTVLEGHLTLGVAEGIETALACQLGAAIPTWSCLSAFGMQQFVWPIGLQSLIVFADNDESGVGQDAARKLAKRAVEAGLECRILIPQKVGHDWLDVYAGRCGNE